MKQNGQGEWEPCHRIYYTGRKSRSALGNTKPFSIGFLEKTSRGWERHPDPIMTGTDRNLNVLAPKVIYAEGKWRLWFRATPKEAPKGEKPLVEIYYSESEDGVKNWSEPVLFFSRADEIAHAYLLHTPHAYEMLVSKIPNLYGEPDYPAQKLWVLNSQAASGRRRDWTEKPLPVIDAGKGEVWYKGGFFGSSMCEADSEEEKGSSYVFFTGIHEPFNKLSYTLKKVMSFQKPPVPAPFYFTIGFFKWKE